MIRIVKENEILTQLDVLNKYVWRATKNWTANEYPLLISEFDQYGYMTLLIETPEWSEEENSYIISGDKEKTEELISFNKKRLPEIKIRCICDTPEEVNKVRSLGKQIRLDQKDLFNSVSGRFEGLNQENHNHGMR